MLEEELGWNSCFLNPLLAGPAPLLLSSLLLLPLCPSLNCPGAQILLPWVQGKADIRYLPPASSCKRESQAESRSCQLVQEVRGSGLGKEALTLRSLSFRGWQSGSLDLGLMSDSSM